jgi:hypothetical protein
LRSIGSTASALLRLKKVPHRLLPPDAVLPGKFPDDLATGARIVCLCYLTAPSAAKHAYLERRIAAWLPQAKIIGLTWKDTEGARAMINPEHALDLLHQAPATALAQPVESETEHSPANY